MALSKIILYKEFKNVKIIDVLLVFFFVHARGLVECVVSRLSQGRWSKVDPSGEGTYMSVKILN